MKNSLDMNDIRNKLTPITTLIDMLESDDAVDITAIKQVKVSVNYLAGYEVYNDEDMKGTKIKINPHTGKIVPYGMNEEEENTIKIMVALRLNEKSPKNPDNPMGYRTIADRLNAQGLRKRNGKEWDPHSVYYIIRRLGIVDKK